MKTTGGDKSIANIYQNCKMNDLLQNTLSKYEEETSTFLQPPAMV